MTPNKNFLLIKLNMKKIIKFSSRIRYRFNRFFHENLLFEFASKEHIFTSIWRKNYWGSDESLSGPGSTLSYTKEIRQELPVMFDDFGIKKVFDAPCGDMNWMQHVIEDAKISYIGGDIVGDIIKKNKTKFLSERVDFMQFDITENTFPEADVWLCRAVLYHLSNYDIYLSLQIFASSNIKYILTTSHITNHDHVNKDIKTGDWRLLNLTLPPFNFPSEVLWEIDDYIAPHPPATLSLWTKEQVQMLLPALRKIYEK